MNLIVDWIQWTVPCNSVQSDALERVYQDLFEIATNTIIVVHSKFKFTK